MIRQPSSTTDLSSTLATDVKGMAELRQSAREGAPEALQKAATQFEAMFMNMMLKSMRDASPQEGMLDNQQSKMFTTMLDQQTSQNLAKRGVGLADMLIRQLSPGVQDTPGMPAADPAFGTAAGASAMAPAGAAARLQRAIDASAVPDADGAARKAQAPHVRAFQDKLASHAEQASRATGIPAKFMLGQAALETGWGKREIIGRDGSRSNNLFGIKAGPGWTGKVVEAVTTEYVNGKAQSKVERFRAYDSYADSFKDYAKLITDNPRYEKVMASAGDATKFAQGLQRAGYATDPQYANKLTRIIRQSLA
jgi:flagellar protein FlgJ